MDENGKICSFQELAKKDSKEKKSLKAVVFDIIWNDDVDLTSKPILERKKILDSVLSEKSSIITAIEYKELDVNNPEFPKQASELFEQAKKINCEGIMIKVADSKLSTYDTAGSRKQWIKVLLSNNASIA